MTYLTLMFLMALTPCQDSRTKTPDALLRRRQDQIEKRRTPVVTVFENCRGSVVNIATTKVIQINSGVDEIDRLFGSMWEMPLRPRRPREVRTTAVGSGFVIHSSGYLVTNAHVVARTAERKALFVDGRSLDADVVAIDFEHDLAVLKLTQPGSFKPLPLGRSHDLMIGETVIAIGNPLGLESSLTVGVVSATNRDFEVSERAVYKGLIQTDASINPGNSGGPLLNILGELVGINTAIRGDAQNIGFAIPVDQLIQRLPTLLDVERRYGITTGIDWKSTMEPVVEKVEANSPAEKAGLKPGDILVGAAGNPVLAVFDFSFVTMNRKPGETIPLEVVRGDKAFRISLTLGNRPRPDGEKLLRERLGIEVAEVSPPIAQKLGITNLRGLIVTRVVPGSAAEQWRLEPTDILIELGPHQVQNIDDAGTILEELPAGSNIRLSLLRIREQAIYRLRANVRLP